MEVCRTVLLVCQPVVTWIWAPEVVRLRNSRLLAHGVILWLINVILVRLQSRSDFEPETATGWIITADSSAAHAFNSYFASPAFVACATWSTGFEALREAHRSLGSQVVLRLLAFPLLGLFTRQRCWGLLAGHWGGFVFLYCFFLIPQACFFPAAYSLLVLTQRLVLTNLLYSLSTSFTKKTWGWVVVCWPLNVLLSPGVHSQPWASVSLDLPVPVRLCSSHWVQTGAEVSTSSRPCSPRSAVGDLTWPSLGAGGGRVRCVKGCTGQSAAG